MKLAALLLVSSVLAKLNPAMVQEAKTLMAQGKRREAVARLDALKSGAKAKADFRELVAKRTLFAEQFVTSESFQVFEEAKGSAELSRWDECVRELDGVHAHDGDNVLVLRLKARCQLNLRMYDASVASYQAVLELLPGDLDAVFGLAEVAFAQKRSSQGLAMLESAEPRVSSEVERLAILKARLLEQAGRQQQAVAVLKDDQEAHLDHIEAIYELGMLYSRVGGGDWPARKMLSLFITRCKRLKPSEMKALGLEALLPKAQEALAALDRKLGV